MYTFQQSTGKLFHDGALTATGWAGQPPHKNDPNGQCEKNVGPLPRGKYAIGPAYHHPKLGPITMNLTPASSNEMCGRGDFRIHGASASDPEHSSEGCIIMPHDIRESIDAGLDRELEVIE